MAGVIYGVAVLIRVGGVVHRFTLERLPIANGVRRLGLAGMVMGVVIRRMPGMLRLAGRPMLTMPLALLGRWMDMGGVGLVVLHRSLLLCQKWVRNQPKPGFRAGRKPWFLICKLCPLLGQQACDERKAVGPERRKNGRLAFRDG